MNEHVILGIVQGVAEWLPVSSEGVIILVKTHFFGPTDSFEAMVKVALFLHFGTFLAALIYFRREVISLTKTLFHFKKSSEIEQKTVLFLTIVTLISGLLGLSLIKFVSHLTEQSESLGKSVTIFVGILLLVTAFLEMKAKKGGWKHGKDLTLADGILLGIAQGFAALPGLSRSGLTVSVLLLRKFDNALSLRLSFLMSLPIVLAGNILLNFKELTWSKENLLGLLFSFIFGLITIHLLLKLAREINFGIFILIFGFLTILSAFL